MNNIKFLALALALIFLASSCASSYSAINPRNLRYNSSEEFSGITLDYKYDLLEGARKYKKKEKKNSIKLIALKVTNNTENDIIFGQDVKVAYKNGSELYLIDRDNLFDTLKQKPFGYLWYLLFTLLTYEQKDDQGNVTKITPIGLVIGPVLAGGNMLIAASENNKFKNELATYDLRRKTIKAGKTVYGIIGVHSLGYDALKLVTQQD